MTQGGNAPRKSCARGRKRNVVVCLGPHSWVVDVRRQRTHYGGLESVASPGKPAWPQQAGILHARLSLIHISEPTRLALI
eukprot:1977628-Alexandrium_andersonii.AAC.1